MGRDIQWREAVVRLLVAARPMTMAARAASSGSALRALAGWENDPWHDAEQSCERTGRSEGRPDGPTGEAIGRVNALERVVPISIAGRRPMGVRQGAAAGASALVRRPRETATWRERWPDVPAARGARGTGAR